MPQYSSLYIEGYCDLQYPMASEIQQKLRNHNYYYPTISLILL